MVMVYRLTLHKPTKDGITCRRQITFSDMMVVLFYKIENIVRKGENTGTQHFLLFLQYFQNPLFIRAIKTHSCETER